MKKNIIFITFILLPFLSSCNFILVTHTVKNKFTPALLKGKVNKVAKTSSRDFSYLLKQLTDKDLKLILKTGGVDVDSKNKSSGKSSSPKMPPIKYKSFDAKGNKAVFKAKQGKTIYTFLMIKQNGTWKVDNLLISGGKINIVFRDVIGIYIATKAIYSGILNNSSFKEHLSTELTTSLLPIKDDLKLILRKFKKNKFKKNKSKKSDSIVKSFNLKTNKYGGIVDIYFSFGKLTIYLLRNKDFWKFDSVNFKIKHKKSIFLADMLNLIKPYLHIYNNFTLLKQSKGKVFCKNISSDFKKVFLFLDDDFTNVFYQYCKANPKNIKKFIINYGFSEKSSESFQKKSKKSSKNHQKYLVEKLKNIYWKKQGKNFIVKYKSNNILFILTLQNNGKILHFKVNSPKFTFSDSSLNAFKRFFKFKLPKTVDKKSISYVSKFLHPKLTSKYLNYIPDYFAFDEKLFGKIKVNFFQNKEKTKNINFTKKTKSTFTLKKLKEVDNQFVAQFKWKNFGFKVEFSKVKGFYALSSMKINKIQIEDFFYLLPPLVRLYEGVFNLNENQLSMVLADENLYKQFYKRKPRKINVLQSGLKVLFKTYGWYFSKIRNDLIDVLINRFKQQTKSQNISGNLQNRNISKKIKRYSFELPSIINNGNLKILKYKQTKIIFSKKNDGSYGILLSKTKNKLLNPEFIGFIPALSGYYLGLMFNNPRIFIKFSTYGLNKSLWKKVSRKDLKNIKKKFGLNIPKITAQMLVNLILPKKSHLVSSGSSKTSALPILTGYVIKRKRRWPFAEMWIYANGKNSELSFSWNKKLQMWMFNDIKAEVPVAFGGKLKVSIRNLSMFLK